MNIAELSLQRPVGAIVLSIGIVLFGIVGYTFLGVREYPAIDPPTINVRTTYTGANAEIMESQVTEPLEKSINGIEGIKSINSTSTLSNSNITVEFDLGANLEKAANDVRDKVSQATRNLPQDIDAPPIVTKADANSDPIIFMPVQSANMNVMELSDYAENVLQEKLQTIPGVSQVTIFGQRRPSMRLWMDPMKLAARGLAVNDVFAALARESVDLPAGKVRGDATELTVKTYGRLSTEEDFNNLIIKQEGNTIIRFGQVGEAVMGPEVEESSTRRNNIPGVALAIIPQPGANYITISNEFNKRYAEIQKNLPEGMIIDIGIDKSKFVRKSITEVGETLLIAISLVVLIVYLFFRNWSIALRPLIDIPVSLAGTFFIMYVFDFSINVLTLLAVVLATGLVVDDGIVVTENIYKRIERGMDKRKAALEGTREIFMAVISTSLTLAVVFIPVIFLQGFTGRLFREFGIVVAGAVLISALVSLTLTPVLNVKLGGSNQHGWFYRVTEPFFQGMENGYRRALRGFMRVRWLALVLVGLCLWATVFYFNDLKSELAPLEDRSIVRSQVSAPEGTDFDYMENLVYKLTQVAMDSVPEAKMVFGGTAPSAFGGLGSTNTGNVSVRLVEPEQRKRSQQQIYDQLVRIFARYPEARIFPNQEQTISTSLSSGSALPVQFVLQNLDFQKIQTVLPKFLEEARKNPTFGNADANLKFNKPELQVTINRDRAAELGLSVQDIAAALQLSLSGRRFGYFLMNGKQYQVIGQVDRNDRDNPDDIPAFYVRNKSGQMVQLSNVIQMVEASNPPSLFHYNRYKSATISASLAPGKTLGEGIAAMKEIADKLLDDSFETALAGPSRDFEESASNTSFAFILALLLIYLILAAQFESFRDPLTIMLTVPLALAGALMSLSFFGQTMNIFSQIGMIMLIGLVTKNGILIVEFANQHRDNGSNLKDSAVNSAVARLRPILMTTLATVLGALPIALALGAGAQSRIPLGIVIVGGLLFSLVLTLFVIPAMYTFISGRRQLSDAAKHLVVPAIILFSINGLQAQDTLAVEQAVQLALSHNYGLKALQTDAQAAAANNTKGNAGMLPEVGFTLGNTFTVNNLNQKLANGNEFNVNNGLFNNVNANVAVRWTVYDGMRMYIAKERLGELQKLGEEQYQAQAQQTATDVELAYYNIVRLQAQLSVLQEGIVFQEERVKLLDARLKADLGIKTDLLQAQVDLNLSRQNLQNLQLSIGDAQRALNTLMGLDANAPILVNQGIPPSVLPKRDSLEAMIDRSNPNLALAKTSIKINELLEKEAKTLHLPRLAVGAGYNFSRNDQNAGFTLLNQTYGPQAGFTLTVPIYQGGNVNRQQEVLKLQTQSANHRLEQSRLELRRRLYDALAAWDNAEAALALEVQNRELAKENRDISLLRLRQGQTSSLELRQAQLSYEQSLQRTNDLRFQMKAAEIVVRGLME